MPQRKRTRSKDIPEHGSDSNEADHLNEHVKKKQKKLMEKGGTENELMDNNEHNAEEPPKFRLHRQPTTKMHWNRSDSVQVDDNKADPEEILRSSRASKRSKVALGSIPEQAMMDTSEEGAPGNATFPTTEVGMVPGTPDSVVSDTSESMFTPRRSRRLREQSLPSPASASKVAPMVSSLPAKSSSPTVIKAGVTHRPSVVRSAPKAERPGRDRVSFVPGTEEVLLAEGREGMGKGYHNLGDKADHEVRDRNLKVPQQTIEEESLERHPQPSESVSTTTRSAGRASKSWKRRKNRTPSALPSINVEDQQSLQQEWSSEAWANRHSKLWFGGSSDASEKSKRVNCFQYLNDKLELSVSFAESPVWMQLLTLWLLLLSVILLWLAQPENLAKWCVLVGRVYAPPIHIKSIVADEMAQAKLNVPDLSQLLASYTPPNEEIKFLESNIADVEAQIAAFEGFADSGSTNEDIPWTIKKLNVEWSEVEANVEVARLAAHKFHGQIDRELEILIVRVDSLLAARSMLLGAKEQEQQDLFQVHWKGIHSREKRIMQIETELQELHAKLAMVLMKSDLPMLMERMRSLASNFNQRLNSKQNELLTKLDAIIEEEVSSKSATESEGINLKEVKAIVDDFLEAYSHGKVSLPNLASRRLGAEIVKGDNYTSPSYSSSLEVGKYLLHLFGFPGSSYGGPPEILLSSNPKLNECWMINGDQGQVTINLARATRPSFVSVEHISYADALDLSSAPYHFRALGYQDSFWNSPYSLGEFAYELGQSPNQVFALEQLPSNISISRVKLEILSNHGHQNYTCIYRFRVYGTSLSEDSSPIV